jgi:hypothetical protein
MNRAANRTGVEARECLAIGFGDRQHALEPCERFAFEAQHATVLGT